MQIGDSVKVLPPFGDSYTGIYTIVSIDTSGTAPVYFLDGIDGGFDLIYLELV